VATSDLEPEIDRLQTGLKRLEAEYNMYFGGRLPKPPLETRAQIAALVKRLDQAPMTNYGERFRFQTLQSRFAAFIDLWDRGLRAREEGRPGPFAHQPAAGTPQHPKDRVLYVAAFQDPMQEMDKLHELYDTLAEARRESGQDPVPFHRFAELIKSQVQKMKTEGSCEVAFRVSMKDGKANFTARALRGGVE
jgi:hypothetical protein